MKKNLLKILLILGLLCTHEAVASSDYMQTITISLKLKNTPIEQVFKEIEHQTDFNFFYDENEIDSSRKISLNVTNEKISPILDQILAEEKISYKITDKHIVLYKTKENNTSLKEATQQSNTITVTGIVADESGDPLIGVTIATTSHKGTSTDVDGKFMLNAAEGEVLTFSYVGYITQKLKATASMDVVMKSSSVDLGEVTVVAIGYGTVRKSDLTGAITSISAKDFKQGVISSSEQLLQGKVAGLRVMRSGGDPTQSSTMQLRGGTSLSASNNPLVVVDGIPGVDLSTVQPGEILSMDILKDASATAIYGSRGANGVIIVTTNREQKGRNINYEGYVAIGTVAKNLDLLSAGEWRQYVKDRKLTEQATDYGHDTDWQKEIQQTAISQSHTVSIISGSEHSGMRASVNYLENEGIVRNSKLDRMAGSITGYQYGLNNKLKLEFSLQANADKKLNVNTGVYDVIYNMNPTAPVYDENGKYKNNIGGRLTESNPVEMHNERNDESTRKHLLGFGKVQFEIVEGLKASTNLSYEYNSTQGYYYRPSYVYKVTDGGHASRALSDYSNKQIEIFLNYDKQINENHRIGAMAGYSYLDYEYEGFSAERRNFDTDNFLWNNLKAGLDFRNSDVASFRGGAKLASFFARANYSFKSNYLLTVTVRRDGSSRFGANNKWGSFPSVSAAWRVSEEVFMQNTKGWLDNMKLRVGYGVTGNQAGIKEYASLVLMGTGGGVYFDSTTGTWKQSYGITQNPNPDLKWESTAQTNIGLDFSLFSRVNASIDVYHKKTSDLLYTYQVPTPPFLYPNILANVGNLSNTGVELTVGANIVKTADFTFDANVTASHNKQKVTKLSNQVYQTDLVQSGSLQGILGMSNRYSQIIAEGYPVGTFRGPRFERIDENGKFVLANDGKDEILGDAQPDFNLGLGLNFSYQNFDLNIAGYGMFGQKVLNVAAMSRGYSSHMPSYNITKTFAESGITGETKPVYSDYWLEDASFFRLQSMTLGYSLRPAGLRKLGIDRIRFYATGDNLVVLTGYTGIDPEVNVNEIGSPGIDRGNIYPMPRTCSFGLSLSF